MKTNINLYNMTAPYYVTMTDSFLSGWGHARGRIAKYVYLCETWEEAEHVKRYAESRNDQKNVNICLNKPYYNSNTHYVQFKTREDCPTWYPNKKEDIN